MQSMQRWPPILRRRDVAPALFAGSSSQAAVDCYLTNVPGASITDFARHGLDSSNAFCGPFPCSVLRTSSRRHSAGSIQLWDRTSCTFRAGARQYQGLHLAYKTSIANPTRHVRRLDFGIAYALSRYRTNIAEPNGSGGDYSLMNVAEDYNRPHRRTLRRLGPRPHAPAYLHSDGGVAARAAAFDDRASGVATSAERLYSAAGWRRSGGRNLPQRYHRRRHRGRPFTGIYWKHGKILDQQVD